MRLMMLALLVCSAGGYALLCRKKLNLRVEFIPVFLCCSAICILFCFGLLNLLLPAVWLVVLGGLGLLGWFLFGMVRDKNTMVTLKPFVNPGLIFFVLLVGVFTLCCRGAGLSSIDELKHWALIVKEMDISNQLPSPYAHYFVFQSYPPASALFIYFTTRFLGMSESRMMVAQLVLVAACCSTLFAFCGRANKPATWLGWGLIALFSAYMSGVVLNIGTLLVDTLLPVLGFAAIAIILYYRHDIKKAAMYSCPVQIATLLTKNSGIFFVLVNCAVLLFFAFRAARGENNKRRLITPLVCILATFTFLVLWNAHVDYLFPNGSLSPHAMRLDYFISETNGRSAETYAYLTKLFISTTFSPDNSALLASIVFCVGLLIFGLLFRSADRRFAKKLWWLALFCAGVFLVYQVGLLGMYLFNMWQTEDGVLQEYVRYAKTILPYMAGLFCLGAVRGLEHPLPRKLPLRLASLATLAAILGLTFLWPKQLLQRRFSPASYTGNTVAREADEFYAMLVSRGYDPYLETYGYVIFTSRPMDESEHHRYELQYRYTLLTPNVTVVTAEGTLWDATYSIYETEQYRFAICLDENEQFEALMAQYGIYDNYDRLYDLAWLRGE